ncbi:MAG: hypothetical protein IEMM0008_1431 [bacterium]|nr:MAG: hypothetical protein IEMM0008_1431 [bacterium]
MSTSTQEQMSKTFEKFIGQQDLDAIKANY